MAYGFNPDRSKENVLTQSDKPKIIYARLFLDGDETVNENGNASGWFRRITENSGISQTTDFNHYKVISLLDITLNASYASNENISIIHFDWNMGNYNNGGFLIGFKDLSPGTILDEDHCYITVAMWRNYTN